MKRISQVALAACLFGILTASCRRAEQKAPAPVTPTVSVAQPIPRKVNEMDEFTGRLSSPEMVEVRARVSGYIDKVHFMEGRDVKQGDLLFTIDPRPYQAVVDRLNAELGAARARASSCDKGDIHRHL
jgi:membrane fusion protein, multidrug efflux system